MSTNRPWDPLNGTSAVELFSQSFGMIINYFLSRFKGRGGEGRGGEGRGGEGRGGEGRGGEGRGGEGRGWGGEPSIL